jgi:hypothetical protein
MAPSALQIIFYKELLVGQAGLGPNKKARQPRSYLAFW